MVARSVVDAVEDSDGDSFDLLTEAERSEYLNLMSQAVGVTWDLTPKQAFADAVWAKCDWLLYGGSAGPGKALALDTPIPTPSGWSTMGGLRVGDLVFTERGETTAVVAVHPVTYDREAFVLSFSDGACLVASAEHRWWTFTASDLGQLTRLDPVWRERRRSRRPSRSTGLRSAAFTAAVTARNQRLRNPTITPPAGGVRTTAEIADTLTVGGSGRHNHAIPVCDAVEVPDADLPVDPYVLGAWLGDGSSAQAIMSCHDDDQPHMRAMFELAGFVTTDQLTAQTFGVLGLKVCLRDLGVLGNKHIPLAYLRGSIKQRLALLRGLMDTDGHACRDGGVEFSNTNEELALGVFELACSLGHKPTLREYRAKLNGRDCGPAWRVRWSARDLVFEMQRKVDVQRTEFRRTAHLRFVTSCRSVGPLPMRCITVENPTGVFLAGRQFIPTHNSELAAHHANRLSLAIPGHQTLLVRQSIPELRRSLILRLLTRTKQFRVPAKYRKLDGQSAFHYANGSLIECGHCATDEHLGNYLSAEYQCLIIDEASQLSDNQITQLSARLRTSKSLAALGARPHLGLFTNPGDRSHAWLYDLFVLPTEYGNKIVVFDITQGIEKCWPVREYKAPIDVRSASPNDIYTVLLPWVESLEVVCDPLTQLVVGFVPAKATDNPHIDQGYLKFLNALPERRRRQLRDGDWDTFEGQYFSEFNRSLHVIPPFAIPKGWQRARGVDFGSTAPYACVWAAWDEDGDCYVYREEYEAGLLPAEQARRIVSRSVGEDERGPFTERFAATVADPSVFSNHRGAGKSIADLWRDAGLVVTRAKNQRVAGWANVRQYLWDHEKVLPGSGKPGAPRLFIFDSCTQLCRTIPLMQHSKSNPEDLESRDTDDHLPDALRYVLAWRPLEAVHRRKVVNGPSLDERWKRMIRQQDKRERKKKPSWN